MSCSIEALGVYDPAAAWYLPSRRNLLYEDRMLALVRLCWKPGVSRLMMWLWAGFGRARNRCFCLRWRGIA
jgi:hypothetical protein